MMKKITKSTGENKKILFRNELKISVSTIC